MSGSTHKAEEPKKTTTDARDLRVTLEVEKMRAHLRKVVKESDLTRKEVAQRAGLTPVVLSNVLREGGPGFYVDRVSRILEAVEVDPLDFYRELYPEAFTSSATEDAPET